MLPEAILLLQKSDSQLVRLSPIFGEYKVPAYLQIPNTSIRAHKNANSYLLDILHAALQKLTA